MFCRIKHYLIFPVLKEMWYLSEDLWAKKYLHRVYIFLSYFWLSNEEFIYFSWRCSVIFTDRRHWQNLNTSGHPVHEKRTRCKIIKILSGQCPSLLGCLRRGKGFIIAINVSLCDVVRECISKCWLVCGLFERILR